MNSDTNRMQSALTGSAIPVAGVGSLVSSHVKNLGAITLAFATGECGSENWGGIMRTDFAKANIQALSTAGMNYVVSTGGQAGTFICSSHAGMQSFLDAYMSAHMVGIDFDMEGAQTAGDINNLINQIAYAQTLYPNLRFSFTLATLAASDGSFGGLNPLGDSVVKAIQNAHLAHYTINLMVMDYGGASPANCVVSAGQCQMGQSAIQAAVNLQHTYGIPASQIELTPMIGMNDVASEVFTLADVDTITSYAAAHGLAGLHFWSLDRDTPCLSANSSASSICNSVSGTTALQYTRRFLRDLGR
ncbi:glycosyl hydrolase [Pseudolysobacter antarcticus]|uniref:Glycosyl hydrolase n=2 Tax=Pseudolysobacter antarcticus TaxID=2511995 RepID=A0A411HQC3_9GAMM|nr:glycosyl hydrolase [Pseudolysobacter antarcticus]